MKAISLWQPWAQLVALGEKRIETRGRSTTIRGEIAIHATKAFPTEAKAVMRQEPFRSVLAKHLIHCPDDLWCGAIVAVAQLTDVLLTGDWLDYSHRERTIQLPGGRSRVITPTEVAFGHYGPGRFAWLLAGIHRLPRPVPCRGYQTIGWQVPFDVERQVREQLQEKDR